MIVRMDFGAAITRLRSKFALPGWALSVGWLIARLLDALNLVSFATWLGILPDRFPALPQLSGAQILDGALIVGLAWLAAVAVWPQLKAVLPTPTFWFRLLVVVWLALLSYGIFSLRDDMRRYVMPRRLTAKQQAAIASELSRSKPQEVMLKVAEDDEEATRYADEIALALERGGWPVVSITYERISGAGLSIEITAPSPSTAEIRLRRTPGDIL